MSEAFCDLAKGKCKPCEGGIPPLTPTEIDTLLKDLKDWRVVDGKLRKELKFPDHYVTMTFVNAVAWISHQQGHHPDLAVGQRVFHDKFGYGEVVDQEGNKLEIEFERAGRKRVIDSFVTAA